MKKIIILNWLITIPALTFSTFAAEVKDVPSVRCLAISAVAQQILKVDSFAQLKSETSFNERAAAIQAYHIEHMPRGEFTKEEFTTGLESAMDEEKEKLTNGIFAKAKKGEALRNEIVIHRVKLHFDKRYKEANCRAS